MGMQLTGKGSLVASSLTAIGASVCCVGPLVLLALGVGGRHVRVRVTDGRRPRIAAARSGTMTKRPSNRSSNG